MFAASIPFLRPTGIQKRETRKVLAMYLSLDLIKETYSLTGKATENEDVTSYTCNNHPIVVCQSTRKRIGSDDMSFG